MTRRAVLSGGGVLPGILAQSGVDLVVRFSGMPFDGADGNVIEARFEQLGALFATLKSHQISEIIFAGAMTRPQLDPRLFDTETAALAPILGQAMGRGDNALLGAVIEIFEKQGFSVIGAHEAAPQLLVQEGILTGAAPSEQDISDATRGRSILDHISQDDVGQAVVVHNGLCLGVEALPGTDALLRFVQQTRKGKGGILIKMPKLGQDLRVDMPSIGPETLDNVQEAGLTGIAVAAEKILVLHRDTVIERAQKAGIKIWAMA